jgi:DNA-binding NarL/FixJ family response regulator
MTTRLDREPVRIVLVDDHEMVIEGLKAMLAAFDSRVTVVGQAVGADKVMSVVADLDPDIVLCDVRMQGSSGLDVCQQLRQRDPDRRVVMLSVYDDEQYLFQALRVGASGFLLKRTTAGELAGHLERVMGGEITIDPAIAGRVAVTAARLQSGEFWPGAYLGLTQRESEVLALMVRGLSNRAIGQQLYIGEETVKTHSRSIYRKLDVSDRSQAIAVALREGIFH